MDADGELTLGHGLRQFVEHRLDHAGGELLAGETVTATDDARHVAHAFCRCLRQRGHHILVERLAVGARFLAAVEHGDGFCTRRQSSQQGIRSQRPIQPHLQHAHFFAMGQQVIHGLVHGLGARSHEHDHALGIWRTDVVEQAVVASGEFAETVHRCPARSVGTRHRRD